MEKIVNKNAKNPKKLEGKANLERKLKRSI